MLDAIRVREVSPTVAWLRSPAAIRERCHQVRDLGLAGRLEYFRVEPSRLPVVVDRVLADPIALSLAADPTERPAPMAPEAAPRKAAPTDDEPAARAAVAAAAPAAAPPAARKPIPAAKDAAWLPWRILSIPPVTETP